MQQRQLRSDAGRRRQLPGCRGVQPADRTRRIGNAPRAFFRLPPIVNTNFALFKNFPISGSRRIQFRWEMYNVFNQVNWSAINTNAQFNPEGQMVNASFGQATGARAARIMQGALRFTF